jgi:glyoxylase-like metal-dependent hydrolase (beta-lactamase superfamily II)
MQVSSMKIHLVSTDVLRLSLWPLDAVNVYVLGDILVDSGGKCAKRRLLSTLTRIPISGHVITHAHFDHQGCSHAVCERFDVPLMCGEGDRAAVETGDLTQVLPMRDSWVARLSRRLAGPAHAVSRTLRDGDQVGGFVTIEAPGHTPGHLAFWRESDRVLVLGDVLFHRNPVTMRRGLQEPFGFATFDDRAINRATARRLAALEPSVVCFGHGKPLTDVGRFTEFVSTLPRH